MTSAELSSDNGAVAVGKRAAGRQAVGKQGVGKRSVGSGRSRFGGRRAEQRVDRYCSRFDSRRGSAVAAAAEVSS